MLGGLSLRCRGIIVGSSLDHSQDIDGMIFGLPSDAGQMIVRGSVDLHWAFVGFSTAHCSARSGLSIFAVVFEECATVPAKEPHTNRRYFEEIARLYRFGYTR